MAEWLATSWKNFFKNGGQQRVVKAFQKTALLIAHDGSENHLVKIQGVPDYNFPGISQNDSSESDSDSENSKNGDESASDDESDSEYEPSSEEKFDSDEEM